MRRPRTVLGMLVHLARLRSRRVVPAVGAGVLAAGFAAVHSMAAAPATHGDGTRSKSAHGTGRPWVRPFHGAEIVADDAYVYWSESRDREYDDRPIAISRAAVLRRPHDGGPVETLFHFERDDTYCQPHTLRLMDGQPAWYCLQPVFDGAGRADPTRYMYVRDGALRSVAAPWVQAGSVAADGRQVVAYDTHGAARLVRLDAVTGHIDEGAPLPPEYRAWSTRLEGLTATHVVGTLTASEATHVWTVPRDGASDERPRVVRRLPSGARLEPVTVDARSVFVSWAERDPGPAHLEQIDGDDVRELLVAERGFFGLLRHGAHLYFAQSGEIRRLDLASGAVQTVAADARVAGGARSITVGGGWVYWRGAGDGGGLFRARLPAAGRVDP